jgi:hypothetical protein
MIFDYCDIRKLIKIIMQSNFIFPIKLKRETDDEFTLLDLFLLNFDLYLLQLTQAQ